METSLLLIRLVLAALFTVAGIAKLFDSPGTEKAIAGFGVPQPLVKPLRTLLPIAEILIAISLLFVQISWFGSIAAAGLLFAFTAAMVYQFAKGNAPDCHCFGQIHSEPVGVSSILRNIALMALAGSVIYAGPVSQGGDIAASPAALAMIAGIGVMFAIGITAILYLKEISNDQRLLMRRIELLEIISREGGEVEREDLSDPNEGLPIGAVMPQFEAMDLLSGSKYVSGAIGDVARSTAFLFVSPTCNPCQALLPEIKGWIDEFRSSVDVVFVTTGGERENIEKFGDVGAAAVLLQKQREIAESVNAFWTPTGLLVDAYGRIASRLAPGDNAIRELFGDLRNGTIASSINSRSADGHGPKHRIGESIPEFETADITGNSFSSADLRGKRTLVAFWGTTCPYCVAMQEELNTWSASRAGSDPELVVFADGDEAMIEKLPFNGTVIYDKSHAISAGFGMYGTPSAVLVDENGIIVSETATGAPNIWSLLGRKARSAS